MPAYALTIFLGAFLLFQVQPLIGKYILPWFGGGPGVWTTCMLFFQMLLLAGYAYAHFSSRWLKPRAQAVVHLVLLGAALAVLPITPSDSWKPLGNENPTLHILALLGASLGLPYFVLSATGPLLQKWFSRTNPGVSPYRLYALSNAGSLLALLTYPFYVESHFARKAQALFWGWGLAAYAVCCGFCAVRLLRRRTNPENAVPSELSGDSPESASRLDQQPTILTKALWLLLPACASVLLLATTNKMCQDVAVIPFLWILPLALYLLSFIICFDSPRWYVRPVFTLALIAALAGICWVLFKGTDASIYKQVGIYSAGLFVCCMVCHGELYRLRPDPRYLTGFYLMIAAGGALGGFFVAVVAPLVFTNYYELHWGLFLCGVLFLVVCTLGMEAEDKPKAESSANAQSGRLRSSNQWRWLACALPFIAFGGLDWFVARLSGYSTALPKSGFVGLRIAIWTLLLFLVVSWVARGKLKTFNHWRALTCCWLGFGVLALGVALLVQTRDAGSEKVYNSRNFYGVLTVYEHRRDEPEGHHFLLQHGRITHGLQFVDQQKAKLPTTYYGEESGIGLAVRALPAGGRRIGVVGLGTGTLTAYGAAGDYWRIYEINPEVRRLATTRFSYLGGCAGTVEVALGDARLSLEREAPQQFDLLALDAFSSDAIPLHLLTKEAFDIYQRHLKTNGVIAVHISNHYLDLEPVVANLASRFNYKQAIVDYEESEDEWWLYASTWILLTRNQEILDSPGIRDAARRGLTPRRNVPLWTDDFASLFQILK